MCTEVVGGRVGDVYTLGERGGPHPPAPGFTVHRRALPAAAGEGEIWGAGKWFLLPTVCTTNTCKTLLKEKDHERAHEFQPIER